MASRYLQGRYSVKNREKYIGDPCDCVYRSSWERKAMVKFDESQTVLKWGSEPFAIPYRSPVDNRLHRYFPDFIVKAVDPQGREVVTLIEVKPFSETQPPKQTQRKTKERYATELATFLVNQAKWEAARALCASKSWRFVVMTEREINP